MRPHVPECEQKMLLDVLNTASQPGFRGQKAIFKLIHNKTAKSAAGNGCAWLFIKAGKQRGGPEEQKEEERQAQSVG